jgi:hypothetical protein
VKLHATAYATDTGGRPYSDTGERTMQQRVAVPAYFRPGERWLRLEAAHPAAGMAVMNPDSGCGRSAEAVYVEAVHRCQLAGQWVLGYVFTDYGRRDAQSVAAEVNRYVTWYGVDGIFFDEVSAHAALRPYYARLRDTVKKLQPGAITVLNPGMPPDECYMSLGDVVVTFEGSYETYVSGYTAPAWIVNYDARRFWHLVTAAPTLAQLTNAVQLSRSRRAGWIYVTPGTPPNPWGRLPAEPYWRAELASASAAATPAGS